MLTQKGRTKNGWILTNSKRNLAVKAEGNYRIIFYLRFDIFHTNRINIADYFKNFRYCITYCIIDSFSDEADISIIVTIGIKN